MQSVKAGFQGHGAGWGVDQEDISRSERSTDCRGHPHVF